MKTELAADAPEVEADADQIKRVLLNVINNALEAMGEKGGTLRLLTLREPDGVADPGRGRRPRASRTSSGSSSRTTRPR